MARLLLKEIWASRWIVVLAWLGAAVLILIGDPLFFRGDYYTTWTTSLTLPFFILGLRAYSSELANDTVSFLYSRPIKWWQIWIAKLLAGILVAASTLALSALVYGAVVPHQYRPFLAAGVIKGFPIGLGWFAASYAVGFAVSMLMPGIALSFAALVAVFVGLGLPVAFVLQIGESTGIRALEEFASRTVANTVILSMFTGFAAGILVARRLPKLDTKERWIAWARLPLLGLVAAAVLALFSVNLEWMVSRPYVTGYDLSPDGRWVIYGVRPISGGSLEQLVLVDVRTGQSRRVCVEKRIFACAWAPDSKRFAFISWSLGVKIVHTDEKQPVEQVAKFSVSTREAAEWRHMRQAMLWNPDGGRLAVRYTRFDKGPSDALAVIDTDTKVVRVIERPVHACHACIEQSFSGEDPMLVSGELFWPPGWEKSPVR